MPCSYMSPPKFLAEVEALVDGQGDELWIALALVEINVEYVEDVPKKRREWVLGRCRALWEEDQ